MPRIVDFSALSPIYNVSVACAGAPNESNLRSEVERCQTGARILTPGRRNVCWRFRSLGFDGAAVLDGGFDKWKAEGRPLESGPAKGYPAAKFNARPRSGYFVDKHAVLAATREPRTVIVNALGPQFHKGLEPSRYGRPGRVPSSVNVPAATLVDPATKAFTTLEKAEARFKDEGVTADKRVICYCGGGISATVDLFLLHQLGHDNLTLYDGSMGEWAKDQSLPIETD